MSMSLFQWETQDWTQHCRSSLTCWEYFVYCSWGYHVPLQQGHVAGLCSTMSVHVSASNPRSFSAKLLLWPPAFILTWSSSSPGAWPRTSSWTRKLTSFNISALRFQFPQTIHCLSKTWIRSFYATWQKQCTCSSHSGIAAYCDVFWFLRQCIKQEYLLS